MNKRIEKFIKKSFISDEQKRLRRMKNFKRMILNMPYTKTYYMYKKNPGSFFLEEEKFQLSHDTGNEYYQGRKDNKPIPKSHHPYKQENKLQPDTF